MDHTKLRTTLTISAALLVACAAHTANASDIVVTKSPSTGNRFYLGVDAGSVSYSEMDDSSVQFGVYGGFAANDVVGVEIGWTKFGEATKSGTKADTDIFHGNVLGHIPLATNISAFGKVGLANWNYEFTDSSAAKTKTNGVDLTFGIGADYQITDRAGMRIGFDFYSVDPEIAPGDKRSERLTAFSIGLRVNL